jgi:hypothetical protein
MLDKQMHSQCINISYILFFLIWKEFKSSPHTHLQFLHTHSKTRRLSLESYRRNYNGQTNLLLFMWYFLKIIYTCMWLKCPLTVMCYQILYYVMHNKRLFKLINMKERTFTCKWSSVYLLFFLKQHLATKHVFI